MIAIDAMGGDFAPEVVLRGVLQCVKNHTVKVALFGPSSRIKEILNTLDAKWSRHPISMFNTLHIIEMDEEPVQAVRKKQDSSLVQAVKSVADGTCKAVLSAGNTGAVMVASLLCIGRRLGIERVPIAGLLPGEKGPVLAVDLGANVDCKARHLVQFAQLGSDAFSCLIAEKASPRIGLLSNGSESKKGSALTKEAFLLLKKMGNNFVGNIEPQDIIKNKIDVVVTDGFTGNILLKSFEAMAYFCQQNWKEAIGELRIFSSSSGMLLGLKRPVIVAHGNANEEDIARAIMFAHAISEQSS